MYDNKKAKWKIVGGAMKMEAAPESLRNHLLEDDECLANIFGTIYHISNSIKKCGN